MWCVQLSQPGFLEAVSQGSVVPLAVLVTKVRAMRQRASHVWEQSLKAQAAKATKAAQSRHGPVRHDTCGGLCRCGACTARAAQRV